MSTTFVTHVLPVHLTPFIAGRVYEEFKDTIDEFKIPQLNSAYGT